MWLVSGGRSTVEPIIVIRIRLDGSCPPSGILRYDFLRLSRRSQARADEIYINTFDCSPSEIQLWEKVRAIARRHGVFSPESV